jgi:predicted Zn-dependent protease
MTGAKAALRAIALALALAGCGESAPMVSLDRVTEQVRAHQYDRAAKALADYEAATGGSPRSHRLMVETLLGLGDGFAAEVYIKKLQDTDLSKADRQTLLAHSLIVRDRPFDAITLLLESLPRTQWTGETFRIAIWACRAYERFEDADLLLQQGLLAFPKNSQLLALRARQLLDADDVEAASAVAVQALQSDKRNFEALLMSGELALRQGQLDQALKHYRQTQAFFPNHPLPKVNIAGILIDQGKLADAESELTKSLKDHPGSELLVFQQARIDHAKGNHLAAQRALNAAWTRLETYAPAQILSARVSLALGHRATAEAMLQRAANDQRFGAEIESIRKEHQL